jgi:peptidase M28-like protein
MIDPRIYRVAFAPVLAALVVLMFSVEPVPEPVLAPETFASDFDGRRAAATAREIVEVAPERSPGSSGDDASADFVADRFAAIASGKLSEQSFEGSFDGDGVDLRNVILTLPGNSAETIVVVASRDSTRGSGGTSSAAATALLLEAAAELGRTAHEKTIVLLSAGGGTEGGQGVREFLESYPTLDQVEALVAVSSPGVPEPRAPHVLAWSTEDESTSAQLVQTAETALREETGRAAGLGGFAGNLFRLAIPSGLGAEAVAISEGLDAIGISGHGERPPDPEADLVAGLSEEPLTVFGNATLALVLALDTANDPLAHGPGAHLEFAGNLIPGWAISLLALTLLLPPLVTAVDGLARASRRGEPVLGSLIWAVSLAIPFLGARLVAYLLALVGIAPDPAFPFDPGYYELGWRGAIVLLLIIGVLAALVALIRPLGLPPRPQPQTLATALGAVLSVSVLVLWMRNPYLGLLCVPIAHVWLIAARPGRAVPAAATAIATVLALVPPAAAVAHLAARLDYGLAAPWQLLLMVTSGQVSALEAFLGCLIAGGLLGLVALAVGRRGERASPEPAPAVPVAREPVRSG